MRAVHLAFESPGAIVSAMTMVYNFSQEERVIYEIVNSELYTSFLNRSLSFDITPFSVIFYICRSGAYNLDLRRLIKGIYL